jgi:hypothetical protein
MVNNRLVPLELEEIFVEILSVTCDADLRKRFETAGIGSTEVRVLSPNRFLGGFMETLPIENRIRHYFETIDWSNRADISKLLPIINQALQKLGSHHPSDIVRKSEKVFEKSGVYFNGIKLVRRREKQ